MSKSVGLDKHAELILGDKIVTINVPRMWVLSGGTDRGIGRYYQLTTAMGEIVQVSVFPGSLSPDGIRNAVEEIAANEARIPGIRVGQVGCHRAQGNDECHYRAEDTRYTHVPVPPGEYRYFARGVRALDGIIISFSVLTNSEDGATIEQAIDVINSMASQ